MADIKTISSSSRHLRAEPTAHVLRYRRRRAPCRQGSRLGVLVLASISAAVAEVPLDDQELPFLFHARSADFQQLTVQGVITFRFTDPQRRRATDRLHPRPGEPGSGPRRRLSRCMRLLVQMAQQYVIDELVQARAAGDPRPPAWRRSVTGSPPVSERRRRCAEIGLEIVAVRVAALAPTGDMEKALQQPTREAIQQKADQATFARRALGGREGARDRRERAAEQDRARAARKSSLSPKRAPTSVAAPRSRPPHRRSPAQATDTQERMVAKRKADAIQQARVRSDSRPSASARSDQAGPRSADPDRARRPRARRAARQDRAPDDHARADHPAPGSPRAQHGTGGSDDAPPLRSHRATN